MTTLTITSSQSQSCTRLRDFFPRTLTYDIALVCAFTGLTAIFAQISFQLSFTPVPISGQTFAVLMSGAVLGARLGATSQLLYVALGIIGLPVYQDQTHGWKVFTGATGGYLIGFIVASYVVGYLAEKRADRNVLSAWSQFALGTVIIYFFGALWLSHVANIPLVSSTPGEPDAMSWGVTPFLIGDFLKATAAGLLVPTVWKVAERKQPQDQ